jgi:dethiobiotin synthetase
MRDTPPRGLFISGTDTGVGKTFVACLIAQSLRTQGYRVGVYKPVASGGVRRPSGLASPDAEALREAAGLTDDLATICPQIFEAPLAPPAAAAEVGAAVDCRLLREGLSYWSDKCDMVLVEGAGGLLSPLSDEDLTATLAAEFGYPLVVVAANRLGVINHALQTLVAAASYAAGLPVAGIVLNQVAADVDKSYATNFQNLTTRTTVPVLSELPWQAACFTPAIDWYAVADGEPLHRSLKSSPSAST